MNEIQDFDMEQEENPVTSNQDDKKIEKSNKTVEWNAPENESKEKKEGTTVKKKKKKKASRKKKLLTVAIALAVMVVMYLTVAYSHIPFIEKWRTIYIETAMTTNSHKWLATMFFPKSVVDEVVRKQNADLDQQKELESKWEDSEAVSSENLELSKKEQEIEAFYTAYWELDTTAFKSYLEKNPALTAQGYDHILIEDLEHELGLYTAQGDKLLVLDTANDLMIVGVSGDAYQGKMAIVKDPARVAMAKSKSLGSFGQEASGFGEDNNAVLVVNASGFADAGGHGSGGIVKGSLIIDGVEYGSKATDAHWKFCGMKQDLKMYISNYPTSGIEEYRWSVEFFPALIIDGESVVDGTFGMGIQPRTTIGQTRRGDMLFLVVDGRQVGYSLGCTVAECTDVMLRYDAYQGMNVDGGSSAVIWYKGEYITRSSSKSGRGRYMPNAFIVK